MMSTKGLRARGVRALRISGVAVLLLAAACGSTTTGGDPTISAKEKRNSSGMLEGITVEGHRFSSNGEVRILMLMTGGGYVEETIQAGADGKIKFERQPVKCPESKEFGTGSYVTVTARDTSTGISSSDNLTPGAQPDCKA